MIDVYFTLRLNHPEVLVQPVYTWLWTVNTGGWWSCSRGYSQPGLIPEPCGGGRGHSDSWLRASGEARGNVISHVKGPFTHVLFINGDAITQMHCSWRRCWWRHFYLCQSQHRMLSGETPSTSRTEMLRGACVQTSCGPI